METTLRVQEAARSTSPAVAHSEAVRSAFNSIPAAVAALCAVVDGQPRGLVATSLSVGVSYDPPMVSVSILTSSSTWPALKRAPRIGISILGHDQDQICLQLAAKNGDRFQALTTTVSEQGALFVGDAPAWLDCSIENEVSAGDHELVLLRLHGVDVATAGTPMVMYRSGFHRLDSLVDDGRPAP